MDEDLAPDARVTLEEVTRDNLRSVMRLRVKPEQEDFVAPNSVSIAEYCYADEAWMRAVCADGEPVGFVLLSEQRAVPRYYLWRFMIDGRYQGLGFGARAMQLIVDYVRTLPNAAEMYVSYVPAPGGPRDFYAGVGFVDTGVDHEGELEMKLTFD